MLSSPYGKSEVGIDSMAGRGAVCLPVGGAGRNAFARAGGARGHFVADAFAYSDGRYFHFNADRYPVADLNIVSIAHANRLANRDCHTDAAPHAGCSGEKPSGARAHPYVPLC